MSTTVQLSTATLTLSASAHSVTVTHRQTDRRHDRFKSGLYCRHYDRLKIYIFTTDHKQKATCALSYGSLFSELEIFLKRYALHNHKSTFCLLTYLLTYIL